MTAGNNYEPLVITASFSSNVATDGDLPLDGILAAEWMRLNRPELYYGDSVAVRNAELVEAELPLERRGDGGDKWYYACSFACWPGGMVVEGQDYWNKRFDQKEADRINFDGKRGKVVIEQGRYKAYHVPIYYYSTPTARWYAFGDRAGLEKLLAGIGAVGKKRSQGYGFIREWRVEPAPAADWSCWKEIDGEARPMRDIPVTEADIEAGKFPAGNFGWKGYRAPYWHPARQSFVLLADKEAREG